MIAGGPDRHGVSSPIIYLSRLISFWNFDAMFLNRLVAGSSAPTACKPLEELVLDIFSESLLTFAESRRCVTMQNQ